MADLRLFRFSDHGVQELQGTAVALERSLQKLIEANLEKLLGVRFLASEFSTGAVHGGRMDTLGLDENGLPVIIEYKRATNENVINQGLFYLDWLMDHQKDFEWLCLERLGKEVASSVDWSAPRLLCIAGDFTRYDEHAVKQMDRNIELIRYRRYGDDLLLLELVNASTSHTASPPAAASTNGAAASRRQKTVTEYFEQADPAVHDLYETFKTFALALGDDVQAKTLKNYIAFKRIMNFACVEVYTRTNELIVYLKVDPSTVELEEGFTRDMRNIGHYGTGDLEVRIGSPGQLEKALPLVERSYEAS